jgi:hypothetical protein
MHSSDSLGYISPALVKALAEIGGVAKSADNPFFKSKYATLEAVIEASKPVLVANGLAVMQGGGSYSNGALAITTRIIHDTGEWIETTMEIPLAKSDPQGAGSAVSYGRRYALMALLNMPAVDDDGNAASKPAEPPQQLAPTIHPEGPDWWGATGYGLNASQAKKAGMDVRHEDMRSEISRLSTGVEWRKWCADNSEEIGKMPQAWRVILRQEAEEQARELGVDLNNRKAA